MSNILGLPNAIRDMKRYAEIVGVLVHHGFAEIVQELKLDRLLDKGLSLFGASPGSRFTHLPRAARLRRAMEQLGPVLVKLGQFLSTRADLVPAEWAEEFKLLQNQCPTVPFDDIRKRLEQEFPDGIKKTFRSIDPKPFAAASIAQVHRAVLISGKHILVKVVRPGIENIIEADCQILDALAELTEQYFQNLGYSPRDVVREFRREILREIDLTHEGRATDRFRAMFADDPTVEFPQVYWKATTRYVLGVEEIKGTLFSELDEKKLSRDERRALVETGSRALFRQCLDVGFFHADPHPSNLFWLGDGRLAFIDCGMVGQLDDEITQPLAQLLVGVAQGNVEAVVDAAVRLTDADPDKAVDRTFRADVRDYVEHFQNVPLGAIDLGVLLQMLFEKLRAHHLRCPADLVLLIKAITTVEGIAKRIDPEFDMVAFAEPYVQALVERRYGARALAERWKNTMFAYAGLVETLPREVAQLLRLLRRNKVTVQLEHHELPRLTNTVEHASRNVAFAMIIAAMLVGSSILVLADRGRDGSSGIGTLGLVGFCAACVFIVVRWVMNRKRMK